MNEFENPTKFELIKQYNKIKLDLEVLKKAIDSMESDTLIKQYLISINWFDDNHKDLDYSKDWNLLHELIELLMTERYNAQYYKQEILASLQTLDIKITYGIVIEFVKQLVKEV